MQSLNSSLSNLTISVNTRRIKVKKSAELIRIQKIIKIQRWFRRIRNTKLNKLPNVMYLLQQLVIDNNITCCNTMDDGRINSCIDEDKVILLLKKLLKKRIFKPNIRRWYDLLAFDYKYGWIPVNIKSTTLKTSDNTGNITMCVYAYTNQELDLKKQYNNGKMSSILIDKLRKKAFNRNHKKDYYFLVVNKTKPTEVIINSVLGLSELTPNINNLPFQVCWEKNKEFKYGHISSKVNMLIESLKRPKPSWKETFMQNIRNLDIDC